MEKSKQKKPGYKHTALGWIPEDWEEDTFQNRTEIFVAKDLQEMNYSALRDADYRFPVYSNTVDNQGLYGYYKSQEYGEESCTVVGRGIGLGTAFYRDHCYGAIGRLLILYPKYNLDALYLTYFVNGLLKLYKESGGIPQLTGESIANYKIIVPPFLEQKAIAKVLSTWDKAIEKTQELIKQKELRKKYLMQQLLTGKKRLPGFSGEWKKVALENCFEFIKSYSISRDGLSKDYISSSIYCIHYGDIHAYYETDFLDFSAQENIPQLIAPQSLNPRDYLKEGDIIMADASEDYEGVGESVVVVNLGEKVAVGGLHTIVLRSKADRTDKFFNGYLFASEVIRNELRKKATGTSVYSVSRSTLLTLQLLLPSYEEQKAIAFVIHSCDKEIACQKQILEALQAQKKGLMQVLLTGKKRIKIKVD